LPVNFESPKIHDIISIIFFLGFWVSLSLSTAITIHSHHDIIIIIFFYKKKHLLAALAAKKLKECQKNCWFSLAAKKLSSLISLSNLLAALKFVGGFCELLAAFGRQQVLVFL
jgi:hypothetical protein